VCVVLPFITPRFFKRYGGRPSELETKFLLLILFGLGGLATWLLGKMVSKCIGVYPATGVFRAPRQEAIYTTLLMSTGLTFGTISSLFGLSHGVITRAQYSALVAAVVASAVVPTLIANAFFLPRHLLRPKADLEAAETLKP
jgi:glutathione-regulated potassium-efflux system ancillary protein KefC